MATETLKATSANSTGYTIQDQAYPPDTLIADQLETEFTGDEKTYSATDDTDYVDHAGAYSGFRLTFRSTQPDTNWTQLDPTMIFRGDGPSWGQTVGMFIWDYTNTEWDLVDDEPATVASSTDITVTGAVTVGLTDYGDANNDIHCLLIINTGASKLNFYLDLAQIVVTYDVASSSAGPSSSVGPSSSQAASSSQPSSSSQPASMQQTGAIIFVQGRTTQSPLVPFEQGIY